MFFTFDWFEPVFCGPGPVFWILGNYRNGTVLGPSKNSEKTGADRTSQLYIPKCSQLHLLGHWRVHSPERFCRKLRVEPLTFDSLVAKIEDHPIFHNNSNNSQLPVYIQLCIFLFRAGHYGNALSPEDTAQWSGVSVGAVEKSTDHVIIALLSHHDEAIHLPDAIEKEQSKAYVEEVLCPEWRGGFLLADGSNSRSINVLGCMVMHSV